jgi:zinc protease
VRRSRELADFVRGMERLGGFGGRSDILAESMTFGGDPEAYLTRLRRFAAATPADVQASATRWLDAFHYTMLVTPFPELAPGQTDVDRTVLPPLGDPPEVNFPPLGRGTLENGLNVILLERHSAPLVNLALAVDAGYASDAGGKAGLASLALDLMDEGTTSRDAFRISDDLDALGARITTGSSLDLSFVRLQALPEHLGRSLDIYADVIRSPSFPEDIFALERRRRIAQIRQEQSTPVTAAVRNVPRLLYGEGHAYGNPFTGSGDVESVESIDRADLVAWHRTWFHPNTSTLIVTGAVTMDGADARARARVRRVGARHGARKRSWTRRRVAPAGRYTSSIGPARRSQ